MNKRKEPSSLESEANDKLCTMIRDVAIKWTRKLRSAVVKGRQHWLLEMKIVQEECAQLRGFLATLPVPGVLDIIVAQSVENLIKVLSSFNNFRVVPRLNTSYDRELNRNICINMLKSVLLPCLYTCNIRNVDSAFVQEIIVNLLYLNPKVIDLQLSVICDKYCLQLLLERIPSLIDLQGFQLRLTCTNAIVIKLSEYCTKLTKLFVEDCAFVDDDSVEHLLKLANLVNLNVANTSISNEGYITLLSRLPLVQNIIWYDDLDIVLTYVARCLLSVRKIIGSISNSSLVAPICPNVKHVILLSISNDISGLKELKSVNAISFFQCSSTVINLRAAITDMGSTLTRVDMHQVVNIDIDNLIYFCPVLKLLIIAYSQMTGSEHNFFDRELPHFKSVREIRLKQNWGAYDFCSLLHLYINLEICYVVGMDRVDDVFVGRLLTFGGFKHVTEFVIDNGGYLSMPTVQLIMKNCLNLTVLGNFRSWSGLTENDLNEFLQFVRSNNLALTINL
ncbi:uncharacterized protein LOC110835585 isoform X1 [Zootermopsis nevadensis]|uniref:Uncharacterized protein n=1 Tax=Zootermopsis nevadensis TaxID=136037 RepID=A0A067QVL0_ZOONE|nr:uncharacterized protein LOC110835585 isoform X1 [Zootermopsis nevadensis]XP_021931623.1 uncharacterized protein LOC110835585 isoform X1 [Zootermopsis nevadensis]XP_021931624.1 uncharacterized protein LOC110835585 isoform X1 [Zootermopsis nevadensis]KDR13193.1 hypothetical protein L798_12990 [Zootermopsis nevadensis]